MKLFVRSLLAGGFLLALFALSGCGGSTNDDPFLQTQDGAASGPGMTARSHQDPALQSVAQFRVGDTVTVTFSGPPTPPATHTETIKEDGDITLDFIGPIRALGKTAGELQDEIYASYVPKYFVRLTVTVTSGDRVIYLAGEVKNPGRVVYLGDTTVTKAIQSAGGLTDFANHSKVWITRANTRQRIRVNYDDALNDPSKDLPVYPDDQIFVDRRLF